MSTLRHILSRRRLLAFLGVCALLFALAMLHPYPRQSLFGPTIRGKPRCVWEETIRRQFGERQPSFMDKVIDWFGIERRRLSWAEIYDNSEMLPIVVDMLEDGNLRIRLNALTAIVRFPSLQSQSALPSLHQRLGAWEEEERELAATAIWRIDKDKQVIPVFLRLLDQNDSIFLHRGGILRIASEIGADTPELFAHIILYAGHPNDNVRYDVMHAMRHFGKIGVPILTRGLSDPDVSVRRGAILSFIELGSDATDATAAIPALEAALNDTDAKVRGEVPLAIKAIDPERFGQLKREQKVD